MTTDGQRQAIWTSTTRTDEQRHAVTFYPVNPPPDTFQGESVSDNLARFTSAAPEHQHLWTGLVVERVGEFYGRPTTVIQSCECGEIRRVEVPAAV